MGVLQDSTFKLLSLGWDAARRVFLLCAVVGGDG